MESKEDPKPEPETKEQKCIYGDGKQAPWDAGIYTADREKYDNSKAVTVVLCFNCKSEDTAK